MVTGYSDGDGIQHFSSENNGNALWTSDVC